ncbi:MAG: GNAT family N-acetyltransferase [Planctomycetota bacterium]
MVEIDDLANLEALIPRLAVAHFELWGPLTGANRLVDYEGFLRHAASHSGLPITLVAVEGDEALGSVNLVENDLPVRKHFAPWLGQLYVFPEARNRGVGRALVEATVREARRLGWSTLYLYTGGTLPTYYERLGWRRKEGVEYLGQDRVVMEIDTST